MFVCCFLTSALVLSQPQRISGACAPTRRALASRGAASTASFPSSCARAGISQTTTAPGASPSTERSLMTRTLSSNTRDQVGPDRWVVTNGAGPGQDGCAGWSDRRWFWLRGRRSGGDPAGAQRSRVQPGYSGVSLLPFTYCLPIPPRCPHSLSALFRFCGLPL